MLNALLWVALIIAARTQTVPEPFVGLFVIVSLILSLPFALPCLLPDPHPTVASTLSFCLIIGLNSFAWGYGLSWLWRNVFRRYSLRTLFAVVTLIAIALGIWRLFVR